MNIAERPRDPIAYGRIRMDAVRAIHRRTYDGLTGNERGMDFTTEGGSIVAVLAFHLVFNIKRVMGTL